MVASFFICDNLGFFWLMWGFRKYNDILLKKEE